MPFWWCGMALTIFGAFADFGALAIASQSLVTGLGGGTTLLANVAIARFWNKEKILRTDLVGVGLVVSAGIIYAVSAAGTGNGLTLSDVEEHFGNVGFILYIAVLVITIIFLISTVTDTCCFRWRAYILYKFMGPLMMNVEKSIAEQEVRIEQLSDQVAFLASELAETKRQRVEPERLGEQEVPGRKGSVTFALPQTETRIRGNTHHLNRHGSHLLEGAEKCVRQGTISDMRRVISVKHWADQYIYASCAGCVGSLSVLMASITGKLVFTSAEGTDQFAHWQPWLILSLMILCLVTQTDLLNKGLMLGDSMSVFPVFQGFWIAFSTISGDVFYGTADAAVSGLNFAAVLIMMFGVLFLTQHGMQEKARQTKIFNCINRLTTRFADRFVSEQVEESLHMAKERRVGSLIQSDLARGEENETPYTEMPSQGSEDLEQGGAGAPRGEGKMQIQMQMQMETRKEEEDEYAGL